MIAVVICATLLAGSVVPVIALRRKLTAARARLDEERERRATLRALLNSAVRTALASDLDQTRKHLAAAIRASSDAVPPCADLVAFVEGQLSPRRAARFRGHLSQCEACPPKLVDSAQLAAHLSVLPSKPAQTAEAPDEAPALPLPRLDGNSLITPSTDLRASRPLPPKKR